MPNEEKVVPESKTFLQEDWIVVFIAFGIILLALVGVAFPKPSYSWTTANDLFTNVISPENLGRILLQFLISLFAAVICSLLLRRSIRNFSITFVVVFLLTLLAQIAAGHSDMKALNLEAVIFSLLIGLLVSNLVRIPSWMREHLSAEMFVKIGLVLLGTSVLFGDILKAGSLGLIQALVVVLSVWYFAYWICKKLKIDEELSMMISSAVSICGVSAAIATAGAIKGDSKKLSYVISLVLITAIPMMIVMPYLSDLMQLPEAVTGAWLGGTIDTTGAVVASGTLVGETALKISTIVKFSQNVLLGLAAFAISVYWTYTRKTPQGVESKPGLSLLWERFPKFVLGFVLASLIFSFVVSGEKITAVKEGLKSIQTLWFVLAFTSIGLETKFSDLINSAGKRPLIAFLTAQLFNILVTLVIAWFLFR